MKEYMICTKCGEVHEVSDLNKDYTDGGYHGEPHVTCPNCGSEDLEYAEQCTCCGKWVSDESYPRQLFGYEGHQLCKECFDEQASDVRQVIEYGDIDRNKADVKDLNGFLAYVYSPEEIENILMRDFVQMSERDQKRWAAEYAACDEDDFADYAV